MNMTARLLLLLGFAFQTVGWSAPQIDLLALRVEVTQKLKFGKTVNNWSPSWTSPFRTVPTVELKEFPLETSGTAWATEFQGRPILVTAGHVVGTFGEANPVLGPKAREEMIGFHPVARESTVVLGGVGGSPKTIGTVSADCDIALIMPSSDSVFAGLKLFSLANRLPHPTEKVRAVGFPHGAPFAKLEETEVTTVIAAKGFFVINIPLSSGFSGGVVIDAKGFALGVITSVDATSSTVYALNRGMLEGFKFEDAVKALSNVYEARR